MRNRRVVSLVIVLVLLSALYYLGTQHSNWSSYQGLDQQVQDKVAASHGQTQKPATTDDKTSKQSSVKNGKGQENLNLKLGKESATFVTLARNSDLKDLMGSVRSVEDRFNKQYHYDWVFLNEENFTSEFIETMDTLISGKAHYGKVPTEHWSYPSWIDQEKAKKDRDQMESEGVIYAGSESYRHMCRFESGFFYRHPLMQQFRYYWRVEPETRLHCDINYDVFEYMRTNKKSYGWTISITEYERTIRTLWNTTLEFVHEHPEYVDKDAAIQFLSQDNLETYNLCHYWSNFEVADMEFWRGKIYSEYFDYLDKSGGFFYERWGDAPVHSIAASLFLPKDQLHFFDDIGYTHPPFMRCPQNAVARGLSCDCYASDSFDTHGSSCLNKYMDAKGIDSPEKDL